MAGAAVALGVITLAGIGLIAVGWLGWLQRLPPNHFAGIRTPFTLRSAENWYRTHRAAGPLLIFGGVAVVAVGLACLPFTIVDRLPSSFVRGMIAAQVAMVLVTALIAWRVGTNFAKRSQ